MFINVLLLSVEVAFGQMQSSTKDSLDIESTTSAKVSSNFCFPSSLDIARNSFVSPSMGGVYKFKNTVKFYPPACNFFPYLTLINLKYTISESWVKNWLQHQSRYSGIPSLIRLPREGDAKREHAERIFLPPELLQGGGPPVDALQQHRREGQSGQSMERR